MAGVQWVGADGNRYIKDASGTRNMGAATNQGGMYWNNQGYSVISDPLMKASTTDQLRTSWAMEGDAPYYEQLNGVSRDAATGGGAVSQAAAAPPRPSQAQLDPLLASLGSLDTVLANRNAQSQAEYDRAISGYNAQDDLDRRAHTEGVQGNERTLTSNNQRALLNAANASTGLRGVMSGLGGLAGSGKDVVARLVGLAANSDTGAARETFETNAGNLTSAWGRAEQAQRQRREDANATLENNKQNNQAGVLTSRQSIFQQLANLYGDALPEGRTYASQAASLAPQIAATSRATVAPYQAASGTYSPDAVKNYLAGTQNLEVNAGGGAGQSMVPVNSPLFSSDRKKDLLPGVA